jgi:hypothetical protein
MKTSMKNLAILMIIIIFAAITKINAANVDHYINNGDSTYITEGNTYYVYIRNGGSSKLIISDQNATGIQWIYPYGTVINNQLYIYSAEPGHYGCYYNGTVAIDIYIRYFVDIIDSTPGSTTYGQMPDTIWVNQGNSATLNISTNFVYTWWEKVGTSGTLWEDVFTATASVGTYMVMAKDDGFYFSYDTIVVAEICIPQTTTIDTAICESEMIFAGGAWQNTAGTYHDTLTNVSGCDSIITTILTILERPDLIMVHPNEVCLGDTIILTATGADTYLWWNSETNDTTTAIANSAGISYFSIIGYNSNGCSISIDNVPITINPLPTVHFVTDTVVILQGNNTTLAPTITDADSYLWSTGDITSTIIVDSAATYYLTVTNGCGSATDSIYLDVITSVLSFHRSIVPTVYISPNPATDFIEISGYNLEIERIEIYSQDGRLVMSILDKTPSKVINVSMLSPGIYYLKIDTTNGTAKPIRFLKQ